VQYRLVGDTGVQVSALGIGTMRFKSRENAAEMIARELELGLTYFDIGSAYSFKSFEENAETWVGAAIAGRDRSKMVISAKAQPRPQDGKLEAGLGVNTRDQMWKCMENSLKRVGVERFDFYQLWDMSQPDHFEAACVGADSPLVALREAREQGLVGHLGFTTHARPDLVIDWLKQVPDFRFITVYYNFNDRHPEEAVEFAHENGVGVAIMGPLRGGLLSGESDVFAEALPELGGLPVQEIALRFLLSSPAISTVLSGMNEIAHVEQNAAVASLEEPMSPEQRARFIAAFREFSGGEAFCTACNYCAGKCPEGLPVSHLMTLWQLGGLLRLQTVTGQIVALKDDEKRRPTVCVGCETCVESCPQNLPIPDRMERLAALIEELAG
jgi:uncharacterized protein